eukprot:6203728-Pleurochrysis_carterae.AAC.3
MQAEGCQTNVHGAWLVDVVAYNYTKMHGCLCGYPTSLLFSPKEHAKLKFSRKNNALCNLVAVGG